MNITKEMVYTTINNEKPYFYDADALASALNIDSIEDRVNLLQCIHDLTNEYRLFESKKLKYATDIQKGYKIGTFIYKTNRYGFIDTDDGNHYYVRLEDITAFDQDKVLYEVIDKDDGEAKIIGIKEHTIKTLVGTIVVKIRNGRKTYIPVLHHYDIHGQIKDMDQCGFDQDMYVVFTIESYDPFILSIDNVIGPVHAPFMDYMALATSYGVFPQYPLDGQTEAMKMASMPIQVDTVHQDFRGLTTFTIDGDDAKDFDDALSLIKEDDGYTVVVSIADVANYVRYGSPLDKAAYDRSTSIYLPGMVIPMLPEVLSNGACSLNPNQDRYAISVCLHYDFDGNTKGYDIHLSVIQSKYRLTYGNTNAFFDDPNHPLEPYDKIGDDLLNLKGLSEKIHRNRYLNGGIEFDTTELQIAVDRNGHPIGITTRHDGIAEGLIEDFMIEANVAVASYLHDHGIPGLYRIHEGIDSDRLIQFNDLANLIYMPLPKNLDLMDSLTVANYLKQCKDDDYYPILNSRLLRTMKKARYSETCSPHYGLGLTTYCHFTSPIRRYPDLFVHRMLHYFVFHDQTNDEMAYSSMMEKALHTSDRELRAVQIEREAIDLKCCEYMKKSIGKTMEATVESITSSGMFVTTNESIDVFIPYKLSNAYWKSEYPFVMAKSEYGQTIMLMDTITIRIDSIDTIENRIIATIVDGKTMIKPRRNHPKHSKPRKKEKHHGSTRRRKS